MSPINSWFRGGALINTISAFSEWCWDFIYIDAISVFYSYSYKISLKQIQRQKNETNQKCHSSINSPRPFPKCHPCHSKTFMSNWANCTIMASSVNNLPISSSTNTRPTQPRPTVPPRQTTPTNPTHHSRSPSNTSQSGRITRHRNNGPPKCATQESEQLAVLTWPMKTLTRFESPSSWNESNLAFRRSRRRRQFRKWFARLHKRPCVALKTISFIWRTWNRWRHTWRSGAIWIELYLPFCTLFRLLIKRSFYRLLFIYF